MRPSLQPFWSQLICRWFTASPRFARSASSVICQRLAAPARRPAFMASTAGAATGSTGDPSPTAGAVSVAGAAAAAAAVVPMPDFDAIFTSTAPVVGIRVPGMWQDAVVLEPSFVGFAG